MSDTLLIVLAALAAVGMAVGLAVLAALISFRRARRINADALACVRDRPPTDGPAVADRSHTRDRVAVEAALRSISWDFPHRPPASAGRPRPTPGRGLYAAASFRRRSR